MIRVVLEHVTKDRESTNKLIKAIHMTRKEARRQAGFISGQTLVDVTNPLHVVVISCWQNEEDWKLWDESPVRINMLPLIETHLSEPYTAVTMTNQVLWKEAIQHVF